MASQSLRGSNDISSIQREVRFLTPSRKNNFHRVLKPILTKANTKQPLYTKINSQRP